MLWGIVLKHAGIVDDVGLDRFCVLGKTRLVLQKICNLMYYKKYK